jgi:hypothetical protein
LDGRHISDSGAVVFTQEEAQARRPFVWLSLNFKGLRPLEIPLEQDTIIIMATCL